jgi:hypothetical protein
MRRAFTRLQESIEQNVQIARTLDFGKAVVGPATKLLRKNICVSLECALLLGRVSEAQNVVVVVAEKTKKELLQLGQTGIDKLKLPINATGARQGRIQAFTAVKRGGRRLKSI